MEKFTPVSTIAACVHIPLFESRVSAGFPSPADDYVERKLDLNEYLIHHKEATFFLRVQGNSMIGAGIHDGDLLIVDRSLDAAHNKVVVAVIDGDLTVKRLILKEKKIALAPENPRYPTINVTDEQSFQIWGVVTNVIHHL